MEKQTKMISRVELIQFLEKYGINKTIIDRLNQLPNVINVDNVKYELNIIKSWREEGNTYHEFELNYYSDEIMEFLFDYKIFTDIELSLNFIECELVRKKLIVDK